MLASRCVRLLKQVLNFALDFFLIMQKLPNTVLGRIFFLPIANDCSVNLSDFRKMLVKKQIKYFDVPCMVHAWSMHGPCMESSGFTRTFK